jgi:hypothetical protein
MTPIPFFAFQVIIAVYIFVTLILCIMFKHYYADLFFCLKKGALPWLSHRPLTAETWVRARVNPYGICVGQSGTGTGFS